MQLTPLHDIHVGLGARMTAFAGFDMPVHYGSIIDEHMAVRERAGMFDVSHMGEVAVTGPHAEDFIQHLVTNDVERLEDGQALYTVMCNPDGGVVDDLLVYRMGDREYLLVINASNIDGDVAWMKAQNHAGAVLTDHSQETALIAVQGPAAFDVVSEVYGESLQDLPFYRFIRPESGAFVGCSHALLSHTGYTGERGLEIYCEADRAVAVWNALAEAGRAHGLSPAGLGCRDTLRLESGFCLYGNDLTSETNPLEAGLGWLVKLDVSDFVGRDALLRAKAEGLQRRLVAFVLLERGVPRAGYEIVNESGEVIGQVTSGSQSPILGSGIGMGYVENSPEYRTAGSRIAVRVRNRNLPAEVRKPPLHKSA